MRVAVLDTNVIVSAGIQPTGAPAKLMMEWVLETQIQLVTCPSIVLEYRQVTSRSKFKPYGFPPLWLDFVLEESLHLQEPAPWPLAGPDAADTVFLALAEMAGAWVVTGNERHFPQAIRRSVRVITPHAYLASLIAS